MKDLSIIEDILRNRTAFFEAIQKGKNNLRLIRIMLVSSSVFLAMYGMVMGFNHSVLQALASMIKLPTLFLITLLICVPSLHFFNILFGSKQTALQSIALALTAITVTSVLLFSFAPITLFFLITSDSYAFFKLLNVLFFTISGWTGVWFLRQGLHVMAGEGEIEEELEEEQEEQEKQIYTEEPKGRGMRQLVFTMWMLLYAFVGTQMAYTLSPFIGDPNLPFILARHAEGDFYSDVFNSLIMLFR